MLDKLEQIKKLFEQVKNDAIESNDENELNKVRDSLIGMMELPDEVCCEVEKKMDQLEEKSK